MDYPILHAGFFGGGLLIALVATVHVFISHFAVGGGFFIAVMETRVQRQALPGFRDYLHRHARFFLVLTMVFGGLTGVGIWLAISIGAPGATSLLIHAFLLGWAAEWTFFLAEIVVLLAYMRTLESGHSRRGLVLAWLYCFFAWGSLALVQGFISFMLTPGDWLATGRFWDGFLNPTYLPGLVFRTAMSGVLAGVFGLFTAQAVADDAERKRLCRFCAWWVALAVPVAVLGCWQHLGALSPEQRELALRGSREIARARDVFLAAAPLLLVGGAALAAGLRRGPGRLAALALLLLGFAFIGSFEWMREAARKPYIITGHTYANTIPLALVPKADREGVLSLARWTRHKAVDPADPAAAGRELLLLECAGCHSLEGPMRPIGPPTAKFSAFGMDAFLSGLGKLNRYMPPFVGTKAERQALAGYLAQTLHGKTPDASVAIAGQPSPVPAFQPDAPWLLTAVADTGINMVADPGGRWSLGPSAQGLTAQLLKRGPAPALVTENVTLTYAVEDGPSGQLTPDPAGRRFRAEALAVTPYPPRGGFQPYPLATVQARDTATGAVLAETRAVLAVSTELGCKNCHGGDWSRGVAGVAPDTVRDVLESHDRLSGTTLATQPAPVNCRSCHDGQAQGATRALNLSAAMHGYHAVYLSGRGDAACAACHPVGPKGATRALRDFHPGAGLDCTSCHGVLENHALSLLTAEREQGVAAAGRLMGVIKPVGETITARKPWVNMPRCVTCHENYGPAQGADAFGKWTAGAGELFRAGKDELDAMTCASCHGTVHALYPAVNPYGENRDVLQPLQYQKTKKTLGAGKNCRACHTVDMDAAAHHAGMGVE